MNIIGHKNIYLTISSTLLIASVIAMVLFGVQPGIDFVGGTQWQFRLPDPAIDRILVQQVLDAAGAEQTAVRSGETTQEFLVNLAEVDEDLHQQLRTALQEEFGGVEELSFTSIGPAIGSELRARALKAFLLVLLGISLYVAFAFREASYEVSSWKYGMITLVTLFHDALISAGALTVLSVVKGTQLDITMVVAMLVIIGFSVHDTIVVFDRIRENVITYRKKSFEVNVNDSVNQTIARSINTSLTLVVVLVALLIVGASSLRDFTLLILIGTLVGTYSSIFVASPLLVLSRFK